MWQKFVLALDPLNVRSEHGQDRRDIPLVEAVEDRAALRTWRDETLYRRLLRASRAVFAGLVGAVAASVGGIVAAMVLGRPRGSRNGLPAAATDALS